MSQTTDISHLKSLPVAERLKMIEELWDSIDAESADALPVPEWQKEEIDRRLAALEDGTSVGISWEEARRKITSRS